MAGYGTFPLGHGALGHGTPSTAEAPPEAEQWSRYIDPATQTYEVDTKTRNFRRWTGIQQRVWLALKTQFGSSSVQPTWGAKRAKKITSSFAADTEQSARDALRRLTDVDKVIRITRVEVETSGARSRCTVWFVDVTNTSRGEQFVSIGV
jgi:hypothetical protein